MRPLRRYTKLLLIVLSVALVVSFALNTWVDPYRVIAAPWQSKSLDEWRDIDDQVCTSKAGLLRTQEWDTLILGSSRPAFGADPECQAVAGMNCLNIGLAGGEIFESVGAYRYALKQGSPKTIFLFVDPGSLSTKGTYSHKTDFLESAMSPYASPIEQSLKIGIGLSSLEASLQTLSNSLRQKKPAFTPRGFRRVVPKAREAEFIETAPLYTSYAYRFVKTHGASPTINSQRMKELTWLVKNCADRAIPLKVIISPNHLIYTRALQQSGLLDPYFNKEKEVLNLLVSSFDNASLYDFNTPSELTMNSISSLPTELDHNDLWFDVLHFRPEVGDLILDTSQRDEKSGIQTVSPSAQAKIFNGFSLLFPGLDEKILETIKIESQENL